MADGDQKVEYGVFHQDHDICRDPHGRPTIYPTERAAALKAMDRDRGLIKYGGCSTDGWRGPHHVEARSVGPWSPVDRKEGDE